MCDANASIATKEERNFQGNRDDTLITTGSPMCLALPGPPHSVTQSRRFWVEMPVQDHCMDVAHRFGSIDVA